MKERKSIFKGGMSIFIYLILVFLFQECALRLCFPVPEVSNFDRTNYLNPFSEEKHLPFSRDLEMQWYSWPDTQAVFSNKLNRYGFRDKEWSVEKDADKKRILFLGDSFVEGTMSEKENTIPQAFNQAGGMQYEVMNAGMLGTAIDHYLLLAVDMIPLFKPDVVFLCIYGNDMRKEKPKIPGFYIEPIYFNPFTPRLIDIVRQAKLNGPLRFRWSKKQMPYLNAVPDPTNPWTEKAEQLSKEVEPWLADEMKKAKFNPYLTCKICKEAFSYQNPFQLSESIAFFRDFCQQFGAKPIILYIPSRNQVSDYYLPFERKYCLNGCPDITSLTDSSFQMPQRSLATQCLENHVPFIDLTDVVREKEAQGEHLYWDYDEHMRSKGYRLLGETIWEEWVIQN